MRDRKLIGVAVVAVGVAVILVFGDLSPGAPIPAVDCPFETGDVDAHVTCFQVPRPPDGSMMVAVLHRGGEALERAPVLVIPAEPGEAPSFDLAAYARMRLLDHRDLVLVDPIGAGRSTPTLGCEALAGEPSVDTLERCRQDLSDRETDLADFGSAVMVDDFERVREALERGRSWRRWHVVGRGYGSQLAMRLAVAHPSGVASLGLGSALPLDVASFTARAIAYPPALAALSTACEAARGCSRFDDTVATVERIATRLATRAEPIEVTDPQTGRARATAFDDRVLRLSISRALDVPTMPGVLPWSLDRVDRGASEFGLARESRSVLAALRATTARTATIEPALWWTIVCSEQLALVDDTTMADLFATTPELVSPVDPVSGCSVWTTDRTAPPDPPETVTTPFLAFDAAVDPVGTGTWSDRVVAIGERAVQVEVATSEAVPGTTECTAAVLAEFFDDPTAEPGQGCIQEAGLDFDTRPVPVGSIRRLSVLGETGPMLLAAIGLFLALGFGVWAWLEAPDGWARTSWLAAAVLATVFLVGASLILVMNPAPSGVMVQPFSAWIIFLLPLAVLLAVGCAIAGTIWEMHTRIVVGRWPARYLMLGAGVTLAMVASALLGIVPGV